MHFVYNLPAYVFGDMGGSFAFCGIEEFLTLMHHAEMVFTNSYHGVLFSLIYHRPFYTVSREFASHRVTELLSVLELQERILRPNLFPDIVKAPINWAAVDDRLERRRAESLKFLKMALSSECKYNGHNVE